MVSNAFERDRASNLHLKNVGHQVMTLTLNEETTSVLPKTKKERKGGDESGPSIPNASRVALQVFWSWLKNGMLYIEDEAEGREWKQQ